MEDQMFGMHRGTFVSLGVLAALAAAVTLNPVLAAGQDRQQPVTKAADAPKTVSRTPWGDPDLQGIWTNATSTPFQRSAESAARARGRDSSGKYDPNVASVGAYNDFWTERGARERGRGKEGA